MINHDVERVFKIEYLLEGIFYNRAMIKLISISLFSLFLAPPSVENEILWESYGMLYSLLIGVGLSGLFCWVFAFKMFNKKFNIYYYLWLFCYSIGMVFYLFALSQLVSGDSELISVQGFTTGIVVALVMIETLLNFRYKTPIICKGCVK